MCFLIGVESFNWVCIEIFMGVNKWVYMAFLMGVLFFLKDGCGMTKKDSTGCGHAFGGCGYTPIHTHIVPP